MYVNSHARARGCELLSDFVYSFFEHNVIYGYDNEVEVVNCFQILYIRSLNTIDKPHAASGMML